MYGLVPYGAAPLCAVQLAALPQTGTLFLAAPATLAPAEIAALAAGKALADNPTVTRRKLLTFGATGSKSSSSP